MMPPVGIEILVCQTKMLSPSPDFLEDSVIRFGVTVQRWDVANTLI
jgi:hypothetical protein